MTRNAAASYYPKIESMINSLAEDGINYRVETCADFPWHLVLTGECKQLDTWLDQLLDVEDEGDLNLLFMKFNRKGQYVAVQGKLAWVADNCIFYSSPKHGDWVLMEFTSFFKLNKDLIKTYSGTTDTTSTQTPQKTKL